MQSIWRTGNNTRQGGGKVRARVRRPAAFYRISGSSPDGGRIPGMHARVLTAVRVLCHGAQVPPRVFPRSETVAREVLVSRICIVHLPEFPVPAVCGLLPAFDVRGMRSVRALRARRGGGARQGRITILPFCIPFRDLTEISWYLVRTPGCIGTCPGWWLTGVCA
jgi:hypothetical protein